MKLLIFILSISLLFLACEKPQTREQQDEEIAILVKEKVISTKRIYEESCKQKIMKRATPLADSLIAEMFAKPLREADERPSRPVKPTKPQVEIPEFPIDSIQLAE